MAIKIRKVYDKHKNIIDKYCEFDGKRCMNEKTNVCLGCHVYSAQPGIEELKFQPR